MNTKNPRLAGSPSLPKALAARYDERNPFPKESPMARDPFPPLNQQVLRVRRRLVYQGLVDRLIHCWIAALVVACVWFFVQPFLMPTAGSSVRWYVLAGLAGAATLAAVVWTWWRAPSLLASALFLDERFLLKERATTGLLLSSEESTSPAGQALLADVNYRVQPLRVAERFPVRPRWTALVMPALALVLLLVAQFYNPRRTLAVDEDKQPLTNDPKVAQAIDKQLKQLQKRAQPRPQAQRQKSPELEKLEDERDRLSRASIDTREQAKEVVKEMGALEEKLRKHDKELARRANALKQQMRQAARFGSKTRKDGQSRNLDRAMEQGDVRKVQEEMERLANILKTEDEIDRLRQRLQDKDLAPEVRKKIEDDLKNLDKQRMPKEEIDKVRNQLRDLQDQLRALTRNREQLEQDLRDLADKGQMDREELDRELDQLRQNLEGLDPQMQKTLKEMADKLAEAQKCLQEGKCAQAAKLLEEIADKLAELDPEGERDDLALQWMLLQKARRGICNCLNGNDPAEGIRPESPDGETQSQETRARSPLDRGRLQVVDHVPGQGFKGARKPAELTEEIRQAAQEAPEAIDRQRLPRSASDMARGYFESLRGPEAKPKK
jgi:uncharacterized coiled-coil DUF342 family protein